MNLSTAVLAIDHEFQFLHQETETYYNPALWSLGILVLLGVLLSLSRIRRKD